MNKQVIPAEAVEAAASYMHDEEGYSEAFEDAPEFRKEHFREKATGILEAAAPYLQPRPEPFTFTFRKGVVGEWFR